MDDSTVQKEVQLKQGVLFGNRWTIEQKLGEGAFGAVFRVKDNECRGSEHYALKVNSDCHLL